MRTIIQVSAAFLLLDGRTKQPVRDASVFVDGNRNGAVRKGDGHYVFMNLLPVEHTFEITAPGYCVISRQLPVAPELLPEIVLMQYATDNPRLNSIPHFRLSVTSGGVPVRREMIWAELRTAPGALRVIENSAKGVWNLALGGGYQGAMLYQPFRTDGLEKDILFTGYDTAAERYTLREPLPKAIKQGTLLRPVWELETDRNGLAILPFAGMFMQAEELEFAFLWGGKNVRLTTRVPDPVLPLEIVF